MTRTTKDLRDAIIALLYPEYELIHVHYDDRLNDEQLGFLVAGDWESLDATLEEWESDTRWESVKHIIDELRGEVLRAWQEDENTDALVDDFESSDEWVEVREAIEERDTSDWMRQMANNSGRVLLRIAALDEDNGFSFEEVDPAEVLRRIGFEATEQNLANVAALLAECSPEYSVLLGYWIVGADAGELYELMLDDVEFVDITNPYLYMGNPFMGSGYITDDALIGVARVRREDLRTDKGAFGYSVNEVFGGLSATSFEATITAVPANTPEGEQA